MPIGRTLFNVRSLRSLKSICGQDSARLGPELGSIARDMGLGRQIGRKWVVDAKDIDALVNLAKQHTGWDFESELTGGGRESAVTDNEKLGGRVAYEGMVMIRQWKDPDRGARICPTTDLDMLEFDSVLMVENATVMFQFPKLNVAWPADLGTPLVIYRGDAQLSTGTVSQWLTQDHRPVDALPDLDPAGLRIAARYPRLRHLVLPAPEALPQRRGINHDRFIRQLTQFGKDCPLSSHSDIRRWWD